jgi:hypothetical protein
LRNGLGEAFAGGGGQLASVRAHVVERVLGLEDEDGVAEAAEQRGCSRGGEAAGEDEVGLEGDDFLGEAMIGRELRGDGIEADGRVDRLLREMGDCGDASGVDDAHEQFVGAEVHRDNAPGLGVGGQNHGAESQHQGERPGN